MALGSPCPPLSGLTYLKGDPLPIGQSGDGKQYVYAIEFWATWCPPCRASIPHLTELQRKYKDKDVHIVGITTEKDVSKLQAFIRQMGDQMDYTVAADIDGTADAELYLKSDARGVPHAFVVDVHNKVVYSGHPQDPGFERALAAAAREATDRRQQKALPPITEGFDQLMAHSVKELKAMLTERGVACSDCLEKGDLARRIVERCSAVTYYA